MGKTYLVAAMAMSMVACAGTPWVITASSDRSAASDRPAHVERTVPPRDSVMLGEQDVDFNVDHDSIDVGGRAGSFRALYFVVENNDIELFNIVVDFGNGERQSINSRLVFNQGSRSRQIDLEGRDRRIKSIRFTYKTVGAWQDGKAHVSVYGVI
jgi:hypothetical protein